MTLLWVGLTTLCILQVSFLCTTIYLHRAVTHRGLELHPAVAFLMHLELMIFTGVIPRQWAAVHRKHHHFTDQPGDPHSPVVLGLWPVLLGNYFLYRREARLPATIRKYTPDYRPDWLDKIPAASYGGLIGLGILMLLFGWVWGCLACSSESAPPTISQTRCPMPRPGPANRFRLDLCRVAPLWASV